MLFTQNRKQVRQVFYNAWKKRIDGAPLEPMEALISDIIARHPEYHHLLENPDANLDKDFPPENGETNPFLHMSLHIAIAEQRATNQPAIINEAFTALAVKHGDTHQAEHEIMECLVEIMWQMQRRKAAMPDEKAYVKLLRNKMTGSKSE